MNPSGADTGVKVRSGVERETLTVPALELASESTMTDDVLLAELVESVLHEREIAGALGARLGAVTLDQRVHVPVGHVLVAQAPAGVLHVVVDPFADQLVEKARELEDDLVGVEPYVPRDSYFFFHRGGHSILPSVSMTTHLECLVLL